MMINNMKAYELNEQEMNAVTGGSLISDVKDILEIFKTGTEIAKDIIGAVEDKNESQDSDIISHGSGASGSW